MGKLQHQMLIKATEIYFSDNKVHFVMPSLRASYKPLSQLSIVLDEGQVTHLVEKLLQLCAHLHGKGVTAANLHPNNVFIDEDSPEDILVTDVGFTQLPSMEPLTEMQCQFIAPEVSGKTGTDLKATIKETPFACDLYSIGAMAKFLLVGSTEYAADDLEGSASSEM